MTVASTAADHVRDPERLAALHRTALLDSPADVAFDRLTRLATRILDVPVALVSLVDEERQFFKSCLGLPEPWASARETPLSHSFCQHAVASGQPLVIEDARLHPLVRDNLAIPDLGVVAYAGIPLVTADGYVLGSFCVIDHQPRAWTDWELAVLTDLAASAMTAIERQAAVREAEAAVRARDEFLLSASHDLKTPLATIKGQAQLLRRRASRAANDDVARLVHGIGVIEANAARMAVLIDELLDIARLEIGQEPELRREPADLVALARECAAEHGEKSPRHEVRVEAAVEEVVAPVNRSRVERVLANLLANAVKYSPDGGEVLVTVDRVSDGEAGGWAVLAVRDRGIGIPAADLPRIFEPFFRATNAPTPAGGSGIGLAGAKRIVEQHGGTIAIESREGEGSVFTVRLPLVPRVAAG